MEPERYARLFNLMLNTIERILEGSISVEQATIIVRACREAVEILRMQNETVISSNIKVVLPGEEKQ